MDSVENNEKPAPVSRRDILKSAAALAGGAALGNRAHALSETKVTPEYPGSIGDIREIPSVQKDGGAPDIKEIALLLRANASESFTLSEKNPSSFERDDAAVIADFHDPAEQKFLKDTMQLLRDSGYSDASILFQQVSVDTGREGADKVNKLLLQISPLGTYQHTVLLRAFKAPDGIRDGSRYLYRDMLLSSKPRTLARATTGDLGKAYSPPEGESPMNSIDPMAFGNG